MQRLRIEDVAPGQRVARTLYYEYGGIMIAAGAVLTAPTIERLKKFGYSSLYIYDEATEDVVVLESMDEKTRRNVTRKVRKLFGDMKDEAEKIVDPEDLKSDAVDRIRKKIVEADFAKLSKGESLKDMLGGDIGSIIDGLLSDQEFCLTVSSVKTVDSYIFEHSLDVTVSSLLIAKRLGFHQRELEEIALGALLHDIGYIFIPEDIRHKQGDHTDAEKDLLRNHTTFGYYLLKEEPGVGLLSAHIAFQHHERQDGLGYPRGLRGTNRVSKRQEALAEGGGFIHRYANIVAVANFYDHLVSDVPFKPGLPPDQAMAMVRNGSGTILNEEAVGVFVSFMPVYPLGTLVLVQDGQYRGYKGLVTHIKPDALDRPVIRLTQDLEGELDKPIELDLRKETTRVRAIF